VSARMVYTQPPEHISAGLVPGKAIKTRGVALPLGNNR